MVVGSRAQVFHGTADRTAGGLEKKNLMLKEGRIVSKAASKAALDRMKSEGKKAMVKVFKATEGVFKKQPKKGTEAYKKIMKKYKKKGTKKM